MVMRLVIAEDHALVREGLVKLLNDCRDFEVVAEAEDGFDAVTKTRECSPDAVLMDLNLPGIDGVEAARIIRRDYPDVNVIMLTAAGDEESILRSVQAGARGYVLKSGNTVALVKQIRQVVQGGVGLSEDMTAKLVSGLTHGLGAASNEHDAFGQLTEREKEVLSMVSEGKTNKGIASAMFVSENTVRAHIRSLMQKLNMENRTQLAVYGLREGIVPSTAGGGRDLRPAAGARAVSGMRS